VPRLYQQALASLASNNPREALALLQQAEKAYPRGPRVTDPQHADVLHAMAICFMKLNNFAAARPLMERIAPLKSGDRAFVLNQAKLDIAARNTAMRAAKNLDAYLARQDVPDEDAIELFGAAIDIVASAPSNAAAIPALEERYRIYNSQLEATRPMMHHWGQDWISGREWVQIEGQRNRANMDLDYADRQVKDWQLRANQAQQDYDDARRNAQLAGRGASLTMQRAHDRLVEAQKNVDFWTGKYRDAKSQLIRPQWRADLEPLLPGTPPLPAAATQPVNQVTAQGAGGGLLPASFPSITAMIATLSPTSAPRRGDDWNNLTTGLANQWFRDNLTGRRVTAQLTYTSGHVRPGGTVELRATSPATFTAGAVNVVGVDALVQLAPEETARAAKLVEGQPLTLEGEINSVELSPARQTRGAAIVALRLANARLR
jgi:tetratricopeptide (TPR) repeat protein